MNELYAALEALSPDARSAVFTVIEGPDFGSKCLLADGVLLWSSRQHGFFAEHMDTLRTIDATGSVTLDGRKIFCEILGGQKKLVICGGGHISMPLITMGLMLGFPVTVLEDRPEYAAHATAAGATQIICCPFEKGLAQISGDTDTFFVIVTRGHQYDKACLNAISRKPHAYIGMIGSRRRTVLLRQSLINEEGCDPKVIASVHSPIGLSIGAETPEEIAVSIMAEIIQVRSNNRRSAAYPKAMLHAILHENDMPCALATIVARHGSAPRDIGTRMLILPNGTTIGTIGGGCVESDIIRAGRSMLDGVDETTQIIHADMTTDAAADEGMACGGTIDVLIEVIASRSMH